MKEFIEKLIGRLEEERMKYFLTIANTGNEKLDCAYEYVGKAMDNTVLIVNQLVEEYKGGWISVKDKLPTETGKYLVTVKNLTGYWILKNNVFVCDYQFDDFIFQGWEDNKVIAWMPLPAPYKEGCE